MPDGPAGWARALAVSRDRTLRYTDLPDDELVRQHSELMSPLVWDLAHVGNQEELWLVRALTGAGPLLPGIDDLYDASRHPRRERPSLPLLPPARARAYLGEVRDRVLDLLDSLDPAAGTRLAGDERARRLLAGGFAFGMIAQHEHQHAETMLATLALRAGPPVVDEGEPPPAGRPVPAAEVLVPAGEFVMGTSDHPWAYDNERPAHRVWLPDFWIDTLPVSNRAHVAFIEDGGYDDERLWTPAGWAWRVKANLRAPLFWRRDGSTWLRHRFGRDEPVPLDEPVQHVCWYEAAAHARWAGRRLPTEAEWEKACAWDPATGRSRRYPWGDEPPDARHANLGHRRARPAPLGAYPAGASPCGAEQMIGDVWEWTASDFAPYPGFVAFPYREYSEVFFAPAAAAGQRPGGPQAQLRGY
ncbi:MAG: ergothioneine biosynthesis protein EgtB, partial [Frankia sp.]|nr:ergothioneine biosynthesis protein EgtB [Frankia sp.]